MSNTWKSEGKVREIDKDWRMAALDFCVCLFTMKFSYKSVYDLFQLPDVDIPLDDGNSTIFKFVQRLVTQLSSCGKAERLKRIWEPTYT